VLVPDIYYRAGAWTPFDVATLFTDPAERARMSGLVSPLTNDAIIADAGAYADFLLDSALTGAGVEHTVEFYPAHHGFAVPDNPTYDGEAAARHWEALGRLYREHLGA
jgi:carboxymethylenebutenolidase